MLTDKYRILGIDPGSRLTGFGVVDFSGSKATYVASGSIRSERGEFSERLKIIFQSVTDIVSEYTPDCVSVESVFVSKNAGSALKLGHARSAAICATFAASLEIREYAPREIKQAIVGTGAADKSQVQHMVMAMLHLNAEPSIDASDALAAALCHGHSRVLTEQLANARVVERR